MKECLGRKASARAPHRFKLVAATSGGCCLRRLFTLCSGSEKFQQHAVAFTFEFLDRAAIGLLGRTFDDGLLHLGAELRDRPKIFPPCGQWPGELLHEMLNSAWTATKMEQEIWTHQAPTQSRSPAHSNIRIGDIQYTLLDEIDNLTVKRRLETICHVADNLFSNMNWLLAD